MRALFPWSLHLCAALTLFFIAGPRASAFAQPTATAELAPTDAAVIVLIGEAGQSPPLEDVIKELLEHQSVAPRFETAPRFEPNDWLNRSPSDARTFAFVAVPTQEQAELYFRGPRGERFMLRELSLRNGLDEVGRELIARVVETSVVALLHSSEGMSREEARAGLAQRSEPQPAPQAKPQPPNVHATAPAPVHEQSVRALLGLRVLGHWTGSDLGALAALGVEGGVSFDERGWPVLRARLSLEVALPQTLSRRGVSAHVITLPMRVGIDVGTARDLYVGLSTGVDVVYLDPQSVGTSGLHLLDNSTDVVAVSRVELRYEPHFGDTFWLALSALADVPWATTRYDVIQDGALQHLATPWRVSPGLAVSFGLTP